MVAVAGTVQQSRQCVWSVDPYYKDTCVTKNIKTQFKQHGSHYTTPRYGEYLTLAHSHITRVVAAMDSCFGFVEPHEHGIARERAGLKGTAYHLLITAEADASIPLSGSSTQSMW